MLKTGLNDRYKEIKGKRVIQTEWQALKLAGERGEEIICPIEKMPKRISLYSQDYKNLALATNDFIGSRFFSNKLELKLYLMKGLVNNSYSMDEYEEFCNFLTVKAKDKTTDTVVSQNILIGELELKGVLEKFSRNPNYESVNISFSDNKLKPIISPTRISKRHPKQGFVITTTEPKSGWKIYFVKRKKRTIKFTSHKEKARIFESKQAAWECVLNLPKTEQLLIYAVEYISPDLDNTNVTKEQSEM